MQVTCEKCSAKYNIADDKIKPSGTAVRCPKCQAVFKVFGAAPEGVGSSVACANCGKQTPEVPGQAVVFCGDCQSKLAGDPAAGADPFGAGGDDPFAGGNIFKDSPVAPPPPAPAPASGGGLFDDAPAGGGGLFDDAPAAPGGGGLFDDAPAAPAAGGMFDEPAAPSGGGLFDDAPAAGGGLFDEPASSGGGLFDEPASSPAEAADPFAEFESPPSGGGSADPFAEFGDQPDDMGFQDPDETPRGPLMSESAPADEEDEAPMPAPVREKTQPTFKKTEATPKERIAELASEYGAKAGIFGGIGVAVVVVVLTVALALLPGTFGARPARTDDQPGMLASASFGLQKTLKTKYYGQAMEDAYIQAGAKAMEAWSGAGFGAAEKEYRELLAFDPANASAKAGLVNLYATWDLVGETKQHEKEIATYLQTPKVTPEAKVRALLALGQAREAAGAAATLGERAAFYGAVAKLRAGDTAAPAPAASVTAPSSAVAATAAAAVTAPAAVTAAVAQAAPPASSASPGDSLAVLGGYAKANPKDFLAQMLYAAALRDTKQYGAAVSAYAAALLAVPGNAKANLEIGKLYYGPLNDGDKAIKSLNAALEAAAGGTDLLKAEARYYLSHILQKRGQAPAALDAIKAALAVDGNNPRYLTMHGDLLFDSGKVVDAFTSYEKAAKSDPSHVDAYVGLGRANEKLDKADTALENYRKAIEVDPLNMRANFLYAALILKQGRKEEAEKVFTTVLDRDPGNIEAIAQLARFYEEQGRLGDALKEYARIIELAPGKIDGYVGRGAVLLRQNGISQAKEMFGKAAALQPENPNVLFRLGQAAHLEGDYKTAEASLTTALARDPYHWEAHLYLGMAFAGQGKYDQALVEYQKTIDVNQNAGEAFRQRGLVYLAQSRLATTEKKAAGDLVAKAVSELERALYFDPNNPDYYFDYGNCLDAAGLAGKARDAWIKAKELRPGFKEAMFALANYYVSFTDYSSAEAMLKDVLKSSPRNAQAYLGMGKVYVAKGNLDEAYRAFSRAAQLDAKDAEAQNLIGEVYDRQGLINQAFTYYQRALRLNAKHGQAHFNLGLYWKDRDKDKSKRAFKAALDSGMLAREKHEEAQELLKELEYVK